MEKQTSVNLFLHEVAIIRREDGTGIEFHPNDVNAAENPRLYETLYTGTDFARPVGEVDFSSLPEGANCATKVFEMEGNSAILAEIDVVDSEQEVSENIEYLVMSLTGELCESCPVKQACFLNRNASLLSRAFPEL